MDFFATQSNGIIRYYASDMVLHVDTGAAYLVLPNAKSRIAGYLVIHPSKPSSPPPLNGAILVQCSALKNVVGSAAESEGEGCYHNATTAVPIRVALEELGHPQPKTPLKTDNATATGFANKSMRQSVPRHGT
mmetsp:Transcript_13690/g.16651  ORF Transcript_13690/g.16651 Transcript_13690/m.16651 type:complete len:133 (+) Transcript_13690:327-725(+)